MSDAVKPQLHGRDHRAGGRDPIPGIGAVDWAVANSGDNEVVSDKTLTNIAYASVDVPTHSKCFQVGATGATKPIDIIRSGWYIFYLEATPGGAGVAGVYTVGLSFSGSGFPYNFSYSAGGAYARRSYYDSGNPAILLGSMETFGPVYIQSREHIGGTVRCGAFVYHALDTPGTVTWSYGQLAIAFMGPGLDLPDGEDWSPDGLDHDARFTTTF